MYWHFKLCDLFWVAKPPVTFTGTTPVTVVLSTPFLQLPLPLIEIRKNKRFKLLIAMKLVKVLEYKPDSLS